MGGWKSEKSVEEQRNETIAALKKYSEQKTNYKVWKECLTEIIADTPEDVYYSARMIKIVLAIYILTDRNLDGQVSLDEILETWGAEDQKEKDSIGAFFKEKDISGDQKLSLAEFFILGFLGEDRLAGYECAERVTEA